MIYVGVRAGFQEVFRSKTIPTRESHGAKYNAVIGHFKTVRGAKAMVWFGPGNPHIQHVNDAERIGKKYADELKHKPESNQLTPENGV